MYTIMKPHMCIVLVFTVKTKPTTQVVLRDLKAILKVIEQVETWADCSSLFLLPAKDSTQHANKKLPKNPDLC